MTPRLTCKKTIAVTLAIVFVALSVLGTLPPAHAVTSPPPWTVSLVSNTLTTTAAPKNGGAQTANQVKAFRVAAVINSTGVPGVTPTCGTNCLSGVYGWQFGLVYDNTTLIPVADPAVAGNTNPAIPG